MLGCVICLAITKQLLDADSNLAMGTIMTVPNLEYCYFAPVLGLNNGFVTRLHLAAINIQFIYHKDNLDETAFSAPTESLIWSLSIEQQSTNR